MSFEKRAEIRIHDGGHVVSLYAAESALPRRVRLCGRVQSNLGTFGIMWLGLTGSIL